MHLQRKVVKGKEYWQLEDSIRIGSEIKKLKVYVGEKSNLSREHFLELKKQLTFVFLNNPKKYDASLIKEKFDSIEKIHADYKLLNVDFFNKERKKFEDKFLKQFVYNSNRIEGSRLPESKVVEIIDYGLPKKINNQVQEAFNSKKCYEYLISDDFVFNHINIKKLHSILFKDTTQLEQGQYKSEEIVVGNSKTTPPKEVKKGMENLFKWLKANKKVLHPFVLATSFHLKFESIHPFIDGNGRIGRFLMNKILIDEKYMPFIVYYDNTGAYFSSITKARFGQQKKYHLFMAEQCKKTHSKLLESLL